MRGCDQTGGGSGRIDVFVCRRGCLLARWAGRLLLSDDSKKKKTKQKKTHIHSWHSMTSDRTKTDYRTHWGHQDR